MASRQKNKGKGFEREVAKKLTEIFEVNFMRVPNSGSWSGGKNIARANDITFHQNLLVDGDIIVPECLSKFSIECKFYKEFPYHQLLDGSCKVLDGWLSQTKTTNKPYWLLFFKINNKGLFVVFDYALLSTSLSFLDNYTLYQNKYTIMRFESFFNKHKNKILELNNLL